MVPPLKIRLSNLPGRWIARAQEQAIVAVLAVGCVVVVVSAFGFERWRVSVRATLQC